MSLAQQLSVIADNSASVVVDRKSRAKIHSRSLIFDPKVAASQDYEFIYQIALEGLDELVSIDRRFVRFEKTLFSETSVNFDRNVQQQDMLTDVNQNINQFLLLISPYLNLSCTIKALEWLVRKFNINLYNGEMLLLVASSYHKEPVFVKFLNVIPKNAFPKVFESLVGFKDTLKSPSSVSILKSFLNSFDLFKLYSLFIVDQIKNKLIFKQQLIFYLSVGVQLLSANSNDTNKLETQFLPEILNFVGVSLLTTTSESKISNDIYLTAFSLISVIGSILPLNLNVIVSITKSIIQSEACLSDKMLKRTLVTLGHLWSNALVTEDDDIDIKLDLLPSETLIHSLVAEKKDLNKFLIYNFLSHVSTKGYFKIFKSVSLSNSTEFKYILTKLLTLIDTTDEHTKTNVTKVLEVMYKSDSVFFSEGLESFKSGFKLNDLEMILMTTLDESINHEADTEFEVVELDEDQDMEQDIEAVKLQLQSISITPSISTFFHSSSNEEFKRLSFVLIKHIQHIQTVVDQFKSIELFVTFLIRFSLTPSVPIIARLSALKFLSSKFSVLTKEDTEYYLLVPTLLVGLFDSNKYIRQLYIGIFNKLSSAETPTKKAKLFLEDQIYNDLPKNKRSILSPKDGNFLLEILKESKFDDILIDRQKLVVLVNSLFTYSKSNSKKFGSNYLKGFILNQWSLHFLPLTFKSKIWEIIDSLNNQFQPNDFRQLIVETDLPNYLSDRSNLVQEANEFKIDFFKSETHLISCIGGAHINEKFAAKEIDTILNLLIGPITVQDLVSERIIKVFPLIKSTDLKFKVVMRLIDSIVNESNITFDAFDVLTNLSLDFDLISSVLGTVQLNEHVPGQEIVKKKRRSSSQTRQNMARDDINNMASIHLKKLTIILDFLEIKLNENLKIDSSGETDIISRPELLIELFKVLTDLDYLGNDGHLPVLYAQETLASCMLSSIKLMKSKQFKFDSNSIRADLIVNSIRNSTSPQVQNRLLLVIAELASLAPEIILHSVMPIFTFMGAHTIKQDDEFSNSALQETVSRVIPALAANGTTNIDEDIEFLLASFVAALQHIPRHRRNKLFSSLVKTLTVEKSLHVILFLVGSQVHRLDNGQIDNKNSLIEFCSSLIKSFSAKDQLDSIQKFLGLWDKVPDEPIDKNDSAYDSLIKRPIFGVSVLSLTKEELTKLKVSLLEFINEIILPKDEFNEINLLKLKMNIQLLDTDIQQTEKTALLSSFNEIVSFLLKTIDSFNKKNTRIVHDVYQVLNNFLDMLPVSYFISSITSSLDYKLINDPISIKIAINFSNLTGVKFDNELNINNVDDELKSTIINHFLPVLAEGINRYLDLELQQSYIDTFAITVSRLAIVDPEAFNNNKLLQDTLAIILGEKGLLSNKPELIISSVNAIISIVNILGIKSIGFFPKIVKPSFDIWAKSTEEQDGEEESQKLVQTSIVLLYSCLVKKLPAFLGSNTDQMIITILNSNLVANEIRSDILDSFVKHMEPASLFKSLINIWNNKKFYENDRPENLGLYLNTLENTIEVLDKKSAISNATNLLKWLMKSFEFRYHCEVNDKFNNNTIHRLEMSFHKCGINFIMKLNDKSFRPLFASLTRWAIDGEDSTITDEVSRYLSFFKFFNKLQDEFKSIITSYYSYIIEPVANILTRLSTGKLNDINLRRILLISINTSVKYDQDDYWTQTSRFEMIYIPLLAQLSNIEDTIGKYLVKAITNFTSTVSSDEHNNLIVQELLKYVSSETEVSPKTKIWTIRTLKSIFQKLGESWLSHLPTLVPYIAELLEDDDESVELEVRKGLVRVIENVLGEPLDRYLD